ncbi:MAG: sigma-54 dependent transcriptional regulator [Alphaproteobacteria bacterium]|nr:sigma-54 dependent transcriptional regulator [Alphaproteobacteria bacterium]
MRNQSILVIEDSPALALTYKTFLEKDQYTADTANSLKEALNKISANNQYRAILLDLTLPDGDGLDVLQHLKAQSLSVPVIVMTADKSVDTAVAAIRAGAEDFISKPVSAERLIVTLQNILKHASLKNIVEELERDRFCQFIGKSAAMQIVYRVIENAANSKAPIFITGESGTGKELAAHAIHMLSSRKDNRLEILNCAAIPANLLESEMFGHMKGAFTGATSTTQGAAQRAHQGTLFLDELTEMPLELQPKLLRFTQTERFRPVGGAEEITVDTRFVCATNRDPLVAMQDGKLREDLFYRLNVVPLHLPPLRERGNDALLIAQQVLMQATQEENKKFQDFSKDAADKILNAPWPGNIRQLENTVRRAVIMHNDTLMQADMLVLEHNAPILPTQHKMPAEKNGSIIPMKDVQYNAVTHAIEICHGNITEAARRLDINPSTIHRMLKKRKST